MVHDANSVVLFIGSSTCAVIVDPVEHTIYYSDKKSILVTNVDYYGTTLLIEATLLVLSLAIDLEKR